jgi:hypothetical protein
MFRHLAGELTAVDGVWTQIVAINAARDRRISDEDYLEIVSKLVSHNYGFTTIDARSVLNQLRKDDWKLTPAVQAFATQIASPTNDHGSVVRLFADLAILAWGLSPSRASYACFFTALLKALRKAPPARDVEGFLATVRRMVLARLRLTGYRRPLMRRLADSTSLTPVAVIVDGITASADIAFQPIDETLTRALADSHRGES